MKVPEYFYYRVRSAKKGTALEVEYVPDADVVEVVRCKDCKHKYMKGKVWHCVFGLPSGADGYCSYGERREGDGDGRPD